MISSLTSLRQFVIRPLIIQPIQLLHTTCVNPAARKGTREKARRKKVKLVVPQKTGYVPGNKRREKLDLLKVDKHADDSWKRLPVDDVWIGKFFQWRMYTVAEAIECHRETHHPSMLNEPNAPLNVTIELNMQGEKKTKFVDQFKRMAMIPNHFDHGEDRQILVLVKGEDLLKEAKDAGAALAGGTEVIRDIQNGGIKMADFHYIIAHPNILPDMVSIRGLLKRKFPNPRSGTLGVNVSEMVKQHLTGIEYKAVKDDFQANFGSINSCVGTVNMDKLHLEQNLEALLKDVNSHRPKRAGKFVTRVLITCPPSCEKLKINPFVYIPEENVKLEKSDATDEADDEQDEAKKAAEASN